MSSKQQLLFWLGLLVLVFSVFAVLSDILVPFVLSFALAYLLNPLVEALERVKMSRTMAAIFIIVLFTLVFLALLIFVLPALISQTASFIGELPSYLQKLQAFAERFGREHLGDRFGEIIGRADKNLTDLIKQSAKSLGDGSLFTTLWSSGMAIVNFFSLLFVTPVVTFFFIKDWDRMIEAVDSAMPRDHAPTIRLLARRIDRSIDGFIRGQALVSFLLGLFYATALSVAGLNHALLIGIGAGLLSFIPFVGTLVGFVAATVTAFGQFWPDGLAIAIVVGIFVFGQVVEGNFLTPKIIGDRVRLHPVWLIFALFVFGYLFGFAGLLVAVPVAAAIGVLVRFALSRYLSSPLYYGDDPHDEPADQPTGS